MAPTFRSGKKAHFTLTSATGGTINYSSGLDDASIERMTNALDVTTFGDDDKNYQPGLRDATMSLAGHFSSTHEAKLSAALGHSTLLSFSYSPESTDNGRRRMTGSAILTGLTIGSPVDDKVSMSFTLQLSGAITATTW